MSDKMLSPKFRGSYVSVITPRRPKNGKGDPKYGCTIVLPKNDPKNITWLKALKAQMAEAWQAKFNKPMPDSKTIKNWPIRDGDTYISTKTGETVEELLGCYFINAKNSRPPGLVLLKADGSKEELVSGEDRALYADEFYSGANYYASVTVFAWFNEESGRGVSVSLSGLLKHSDGERFGGNSYTSGDFDEVAGGGAAKKPAAGAEDPEF